MGKRLRAREYRWRLRVVVLGGGGGSETRLGCRSVRELEDRRAVDQLLAQCGDGGVESGPRAAGTGYGE